LLYYCCVRLHPRGHPRKHRFPASPLARWLLPSNICCLAICFAVFA
jgi:hypothetical protein